MAIIMIDYWWSINRAVLINFLCVKFPQPPQRSVVPLPMETLRKS